MQPAHNRFYPAFMIALSLIPVLAVYTPRFLSFGPVLVGLVAGLCWIHIYKQKIEFQKPYLALIVSLGLLWSISALWSVSPVMVIEKTIKIIPLLFLGVFLISLPRSLSADGIRPWLWLFPAGITCGALLISLELLFDLPVYRLMRNINTTDYVGTAVLNRSVVAITLSFFIALPLIREWNGGQKEKTTLTATLILAMIAMLALTESQSGQLSFLIGLLVYFWFPYRYKHAYKILTATIFILLLSTPWLAQFMFTHLASGVQQSAWLSEGYAANRMEIWDFVSRYALQQPLYGFGLEATRLVESFGDSFLYHDKPTVLHPHNFAVQLWMEFGLVGALFGSIFFTVLIQKIGILEKQQAQVPLTILLTTTTAAAISYGLWQGWWLGEFLFLAALCNLTIHIQANQSHNRNGQNRL